MIRLPALSVYLFQASAGASFFTLYSVLSGVYRIQVGGLDPLQLILVGSVLELSIFLFEIPTGVVADVYSRRLSIVIGYATIGAGFLLESYLPTFAGILAAQVIWGVGYTFTSGASSAWVVDEVGRDSMEDVFLRGSQYAQFGALAAMAVAVVLGAHDLALPLRVAGLGYLALAVASALVMPENGFRPLPQSERGTFAGLLQTFREGTRVVRRSPSLLWILLVALLFGLSSEPLDRLWELHLLENFTLPEIGPFGVVAWFGLLQAVSLVLGILVTGWIRRRRHVNRSSPLSLLVGLNLGLVAAISVFALTSRLEMALVAYCTLSVLRRVTGPILNTVTNEHIPSEVRATVLSMRTQFDSLGQVVGGPALGAWARASGVAAALLASAVALLPAAFVFRRVLPSLDLPRERPAGRTER